MIEKGEFRPFVRATVVCALIVSVALLDSAGAMPSGEPPAAANAFLDRFVGRWIGEGTAFGTAIKEALVCERALDGTFLFMQQRQINGNFEADTYVGYRAEEARYELYSFNNNIGLGSSLPVRLMTGQRAGETLVMQERPGHEPLRYTFEFVDEDTFRLTKTFVTGRNERTIVTEVFRRQPPE